MLGAVEEIVGKHQPQAIYATVPPFYVALSVIVSGAVGVISGWYPASKAAKLDPIVALRAE